MEDTNLVQDYERENDLDELIFGETDAILKDVFDRVDEAYYSDKCDDYLVECCRCALDKMVTLHWFRYDPGECKNPPQSSDPPPEPSAPDALCTKLIPIKPAPDMTTQTTNNIDAECQKHQERLKNLTKKKAHLPELGKSPQFPLCEELTGNLTATLRRFSEPEFEIERSEISRRRRKDRGDAP
ncbi:hypothetical protein M8J76_014930 [Diaphorina citri]|nr:hypothetical protein M8J76_014930 [Diaphorina citri]